MTLRVSSLFHVSAPALFPINALHLILDRKVALLFRRLDKTNPLCLRLCSNVNGRLTVLPRRLSVAIFLCSSAV